MFLQSVRFKIVIWYMFILAMTLTVLGIVLFHNFHHKLSQDINDLLRERAQGVVDSIEAYWEAERVASNSVAVQFSKENNLNFIRIAQRWVEERNLDADLVNLVVNIFDQNGHLITSSRNATVDHSPEVLRNLRAGKNTFHDFNLKNESADVTQYRSYTAPILENNKIAYVVQVASPLRGLHAALRSLSLLMCILLPLTVILTGVAGAFLAQLALKPVHDMIDAIHQITADNLTTRLTIPPTKDEIESLAVTFNGMIARLDDAFSSQRQFMEDISHELKTPLSILKGELEVTLKKIRSAQEYESTLTSSLEEVNRMAKIVEDLLSLARFDTKTVAIDKQRVDVDEVLFSVFDDVKVLADLKFISLVPDFKNTEGLSIMADPSQIKRMLINLLDNAIKYTPSNGQVRIQKQKTSAGVQIEISDTGVGIKEQDASHVFDRFYRVDKSRSTKGFGLGLSVAQSIAKLHGGKITVRPNHPQGSIFTIYLPV